MVFLYIFLFINNELYVLKLVCILDKIDVCFVVECEHLVIKVLFCFF